MARIPQGNFGQAIAKPAPQVNMRIGDPIGQAMQGLGQTAANIGNDLAAQQLMESAERVARAAVGGNVDAFVGCDRAALGAAACAACRWGSLLCRA